MMNCLITGVGGQGTVLSSKLIAEAAIKNGFTVRTTETIGMAQRGGSVVSHIRIGQQIYSPLISKGQADVIVAFEPAEAVRMLPYLKKDGVVIVNTEPVKPIINSGDYKSEHMLQFLQERVTHLKLVDGNKVCEACQNSRVLNVALIGATLAMNVLPISREIVEATIKNQMKETLVEMNLKALDLGYQL